MERRMFKRNGIRRLNWLSSKANKLAAMLALMSLTILLPNCATTPITATSVKSVCAGWRPITFSAAKDTRETVDQVRTHNKTGQRRRCWK